MPSTKKNNKKKNCRRNKETKKNNSVGPLPPSFAFPVPPRSNDSIIGKIGPNSNATESTVAELEHALWHEKESQKHLDILKKVKEGEDVRTYETPSMVKCGPDTRLVVGYDAPFRVMEMEIPACKKATVLRDTDMGLKDSKTKWPGGDVLVLRFKRSRDNGMHLSVFMGECYLCRKDLWDFAVQFREGQGRFSWPDYWLVLQCPFCAKLATPSVPGEQHWQPGIFSLDESTYIMISQSISQMPVESPGITQRWMPRLCCKTCFLRNIESSDDTDDDGSYPNILQMSLPAIHFGRNHPMAIHPTPTAYTLEMFYDETGMKGALEKALASTFVEACSGRDSLNARISKSETKANRGQQVVVMKLVDRKVCATCGVSSLNLMACSRCKEVFYCGMNCQKKGWKVHKRICKKIDKEKTDNHDDNVPTDNKNPILHPGESLSCNGLQEGGKVTMDNNTKTATVAETGGVASFESFITRKKKHPCLRCHTNPDDEGCAAMCVSCGIFIVCGPCSVKPDMGGQNGYAPCPFFMCASCSQKNKLKKHTCRFPARLLRLLLDKKPEGRHVRYARLMLAQCMLHDLEHVTGIKQDMKTAKKEYLWLANHENYALAQFALGTFWDPCARESGEFWDGPINLEEVKFELGFNSTYKTMESLFPTPNKTKALAYYNKAVKNDLLIALQAIGTKYKNGELFSVNKSKAARMLETAALRGDSRAMCNLGQMIMNGDGVPQNMKEGIQWYSQAADLGIYSAKFMIAQFGWQQAPASILWRQGKKRVKELIEDEWQPPSPEFAQMWQMVLTRYGY
uniref:MYND-type domain-containing protein n=1 Tax=Corethron hystrix TaxID=216773 RepID=A0A7S1B3B4_9STRA|mmetsp:Transcript_1121/g.2204  ORF Transcript_1121/g.2204 Transcript_1121/m.2204 type:complete len:798 (+) Transcript_1121:139-2532(+)